MPHILGTHRTMTVGVSAGHVPAVALARTSIGIKLVIDLGATRLLVSLGASPREALEALRDGLDAVLTESKETV